MLRHSPSRPSTDANEIHTRPPTQEALPGFSMPGTEGTSEWQRVSPKAIMRGTKKGWLLLAIVALQTLQVFGWYSLAWLPAIPLVYLLNRQWYRHAGYARNDIYFLSRRGWLNRVTECVPIRNVQNVSLRQSWFDRRLGLATISIDIAGQSNTGGGPKLRHVPLADAKTIQSELIQRVADLPFTW